MISKWKIQFNLLKSKLNSNPYHYELKFILTSKQKYNSKFQEFETVRTLKIQKATKFGPFFCILRIRIGFQILEIFNLLKALSGLRDTFSS